MLITQTYNFDFSHMYFKIYFHVQCKCSDVFTRKSSLNNMNFQTVWKISFSNKEFRWRLVKTQSVGMTTWENNNRCSGRYVIDNNLSTIQLIFIALALPDIFQLANSFQIELSRRQIRKVPTLIS